MATQRKAKRKLSDISFEREGAHVALTSKAQSGPANGHDYALVLKANNFSEEFVQKMQQVKVTMELPEFLQRFFSVYGSDAEILARMMGYEPPEMPSNTAVSSYGYEHEDYIQSKLEAFEILKSAYETESLAEVLSELDETEYLSMLNDQSLIEKALEELQKAYKPKVGDMVTWNSSGGMATGKVTKIVTDGSLAVPETSFSLNGTENNPAVMIKLYRDGKATDTMVGHKAGTLSKVQKSLNQESEPTAFADGNDTSPACEVKEVEVSPSVVKQKLEKSMPNKTQETEVIQKEVEVVEKSQFVAIEKALEDQRVLLEKALAQVTQFEAEKKEAIAKAKTEKVLAVVKDETHTKAIAKAALSLESEDDFSAFMAAIEAMMQTVEASQMFVEKGASIEAEVQPEVSPLERMLKAKFQAK